MTQQSFTINVKVDMDKVYRPKAINVFSQRRSRVMGLLGLAYFVFGVLAVVAFARDWQSATTERLWSFALLSFALFHLADAGGWRKAYRDMAVTAALLAEGRRKMPEYNSGGEREVAGEIDDAS